MAREVVLYKVRKRQDNMQGDKRSKEKAKMAQEGQWNGEPRTFSNRSFGVGGDSGQWQ